MKSIRAFLSAMRTVAAGRLAYRGDLYVSMAVMLLGEAMLPLITWLIYRSGATFPGWTLAEAMLIQAVFMLAQGIAYPFFYGMVYNTLDRVREGTFEVLLLKPRSALFMTLVTGFSLDGLGRLIGGAVLLSVTVTALPAPGIAAWFGFGFAMTLSSCVLFGCALMMSGLLFHWVGSSRVYEIHDAALSFGRYPQTIFARPLRIALSSVVPIAAVAFVPASVLLGRVEADVAVAAGSSVLFLAVAIAFWHYMLSKYTSAGG